MSWIEQLNSGPHRISLGDCSLEILHWSYASHLIDNVLHRHTYFEVCLVGDYGRGKFIVQNQPHAIAPGDLFIARPGVLHRIINTRNPDMELFWVSFAISPTSVGKKNLGCETTALFQAFSQSDSLVVQDENDQVRGLWQALKTITQNSGKAGYKLQQENLMSSLLVAIAQVGAGESIPCDVGQPSNSPGQTLARLAVRYIHDNLDRRLAVSEVADYIHLSPRHLSRLVNEFTGAPPAAYIETARLDRARALLRDTELPIKVVAAQVGYNNVQHFTRAFQRAYKITPGAFRKSGASYSKPIQVNGELV